MGRTLVAVTALAVALGSCTGTGDQKLPRLEGESVVDGSRLSSDDFSARVLVVNAWATWCGPCRAEQPVLSRLSRDYRDRGVSFLGINHMNDRASAREWIEDEFKVPYPSLFDPSGEFAAALGYPGLPATIVADATATIRFRWFGPITERMLTQALEDVLS